MEASIMSISSLLLKKPNRHLPLHRHRRFAFAAPSLSPISPPPAAIVSIPVPRARMQPNANANPLSLSVSAAASSNDNGGETTSDGDLSVELSESDPKLVPDDASATEKDHSEIGSKSTDGNTCDYWPCCCFSLGKNFSDFTLRGASTFLREADGCLF